MNLTDSRYRPVILCLYAGAFALALVPLLDPLAALFPFGPGDPAARYALLTGVLDRAWFGLGGILFGALVALAADDRVALHRVGQLSLALAGLIVLALLGLVVQVLTAGPGPDLMVGGAGVGVGRRLLGDSVVVAVLVALGLAIRRSLAALPGRTAGPRRTSDRLDPGNLR